MSFLKTGKLGIEENTLNTIKPKANTDCFEMITANVKAKFHPHYLLSKNKNPWRN